MAVILSAICTIIPFPVDMIPSIFHFFNNTVMIIYKPSIRMIKHIINRCVLPTPAEAPQGANFAMKAE